MRLNYLLSFDITKPFSLFSFSFLHAREPPIPFLVFLRSATHVLPSPAATVRRRHDSMPWPLGPPFIPNRKPSMERNLLRFLALLLPALTNLGIVQGLLEQGNGGSVVGIHPSKHSQRRLSVSISLRRG